MTFRPYVPEDLPKLQSLAIELWPDEPDYVPGRETVFVAEDSGALIGFASVSVRDYVNDCEDCPCPHLEGWFVQEPHRGKGIGRALIQAVEQWARERGFTELTSDTWTWNKASVAAHERVGFALTSEIQYFRKEL